MTATAVTAKPETKPTRGSTWGGFDTMRQPMGNDYVRKDVFDATIHRIDQRFDSLEKRMDERFAAMNEKMEQGFALTNERMDKHLAQYEVIASHIEGDIKALNARLDTQQTKFGWYLTIFGLVITVVIAAIQLWK